MRKEFMVERQGKSFVLYAGLLDLAHQNGLKSIKTEIIQIPHEANNRVAVVMATVTMLKDGVECTFTGIGDASPANTAPAMQNCLLRLAETRAKARGLRDATNIAMCSLEELGTEEAPAQKSHRQAQQYTAPVTVQTPRIVSGGLAGQCAGCNAPAGARHGAGCKVAA